MVKKKISVNPLAGYISAGENQALTKSYVPSFFEYLFLRGEPVNKTVGVNLGAATIYTVPQNVTFLLFSFSLSLLVDGGADAISQVDFRTQGAGGGVEQLIARLRCKSSLAASFDAPTGIIAHDLTIPIVIQAGKSLSMNNSNAQGSAIASIFGILVPNSII